MKKSVIAIIAVALIVLVVGGIFLLKKGDKNEATPVAAVKLETAQDLIDLVDKIYEKTNNEMFGLETREIELDDDMAITAYTGLTSTEKLDKVVVSESMITSTAYSVAVVKVKNASDVEAVKKEMVDNVDMRRWICVMADVVYATNYNDVIFMIMASEENAKPEYDAFKEIVGGKVGKELTREIEPLDF